MPTSALRSLRRAPGFTAVVVLTFALGIGANVTMFGILDRMLFRAPPHLADPARVFVVQRTQMFQGKEFTGDRFSYPSFDDLRRGSPQVVSAGASARANEIPLGHGADARSVRGLLVTDGWFETLGVRAALGRFILPDEARPGTAQPVVVVSYGFWQRHFAGADDVLGRTLDLGMRRYTVVGVAPEGFAGTDLQPVDVWLPLGAADGLRFARGDGWNTERNSQWLLVHVRLRDGVAPAALAAPLTAAFLPGERDRYRGGEPPRIWLESVLPLQRRERRATEKVAMLVGAVSVLVLLVSIANVANLMLARALRRQREVAVRLALGMPRWRFARDVAVEALVVALAGGAAALLLARWGGEVLRATLLGDVAWSPGIAEPRLVAFLVLVAVLSGLVAAIVPAVQASRPSLLEALRSGAREGGGQRARTRQLLLVVQVALTVVLLAGTGLFVRSLRNVHAIDTGMQPERVLLARVNLRGAGYRAEQEPRIYDDLLRRVEGLPGVASAALATGVPFANSSSTTITIPGRDSTPTPGTGTPVLNAVTAGYLRTLGARLLEGRDLTAADVATRTRVAVVSRSFARFYWPDRSAIGECFRMGDTVPCTTVVGVVADMKRGSLTEEPEAQYFIPLGTEPAWVRGRALFVRPASGDPAHVASSVAKVMRGASGDLPYADLQVLYDLTESERRPWKLGATMFTAFGILALLLSAVGLYGVLAYGVTQRTHELGVRRALGAQVGNVIALVVRQGVGAASAGAALGIAVALAAGRFVEPHLYRISARDPIVLSAVLLTLVIVAVIASLVPAWRASRVSPMVAMRSE